MGPDHFDLLGISGFTPGETKTCVTANRLDTATRMAMHADFSYRRELAAPARERFHKVNQIEVLDRILKEAGALMSAPAYAD